MLSQIISTFGVTFVIAILFGLLTLNAKGKNATRDDADKILFVPGWVYWFLGGGGLFVCCLGLGVVWFDREEAIAGYCFIGFGLIFLALTFAVKKFCITEVRWNEHGVSGPKGFFGLEWSEYNWKEAKHIGYAKNGNLCITFADRTKFQILAWSAGWTELIDDIQIYAPHVEIDPKIMEAVAPES